MIGHEDSEEVQFKVADKRKFNSDGSLREGVVIEKAAEAAPSAVPPQEPAKDLGPVTQEVFAEDAGFDDAGADEEIPGANDPASFVNFLSTIATNAAAALGAVPHPASGKRSLDLDSAKYWLDILGMLSEKTAGNLHPQENRLLEGLLGDLRMQYVQLVRATEEKLKSQAAQKFSGADILGKK